MFPVSRSRSRTRHFPSVRLGRMTRAPWLKSKRMPSGPSCVGRLAGGGYGAFLSGSGGAVADGAEAAASGGAASGGAASGGVDADGTVAAAATAGAELLAAGSGSTDVAEAGLSWITTVPSIHVSPH